jgi:hypothetical protein
MEGTIAHVLHDPIRCSYQAYHAYHGVIEIELFCIYLRGKVDCVTLNNPLF